MTNQTSPSPIPIDAEYRLMVRAARMYYLDDLTQQEIGEALGFSRVKINRLIQHARQLGIIKVSIEVPETSLLDQEDALRRKFNLRDALVVPAAEPGEPLYRALAEGTARWLAVYLRPGLHIGLGMGRTLSYLPRVFKPGASPDVIFHEIIGGSAQNSGGLVTYNISSSMASLTGGQAEYIYAPILLSSAEASQALMREPSIATALTHARQCEIVLQSVGPVDTSALLFVHGFLKQEDLQLLRERGAVGDVLGHFIDAAGQPVRTPLDDCIIGLGLEDFQQIPFSVIAAAGTDKAEVIHAALAGRYANVLITDSRTAEVLLEE
jgi:lsr operon transcriptional repressor